MEGPKHGRTYRRGAITKSYKVSGKAWRKWKGTGAKARMSGGRVQVITGYQFHRASAPGEAPAVDLGKLRASYEAERTGSEAAMVFSNSVYAARLELGGSDSRGRYIAPRPALKPAALKAYFRFLKRMDDMLGDLEG
jgi:phage gpG-like protein